MNTLLIALAMIPFGREGSIVHTQQINLIQSVIMVESSDNDSAHNLSEDAVGCLQIRPIMVREVNRLLKRRGDDRVYTLQDRWNRRKSIEMFLVFNRNITKFEEQCRRWNGGPNGMNKPSTRKYWNKVKSILNKMR
jgi:hypothetical protein